MQAIYPLKIQAIRSKGQQARFYVYFPLPLAAAIGLQAGEEVQWELLDRGELHLIRKQLPQLQATQRASQGREIPLPPPQNRLSKTNAAAEPTQVAPDPPVRENLTHDFLPAYEIWGLVVRR
jgi:hypothetical protein